MHPYGRDLFETEEAHARGDVADYLEQISENLRHGELTLVSGDDEVTVEPPENASFRVEVGIDPEEDEVSVGFEVSWTEDRV